MCETAFKTNLRDIGDQPVTVVLTTGERLRCSIQFVCLDYISVETKPSPPNPGRAWLIPLAQIVMVGG